MHRDYHWGTNICLTSASTRFSGKAIKLPTMRNSILKNGTNKKQMQTKHLETTMSISKEIVSMAYEKQHVKIKLYNF